MFLPGWKFRTVILDEKARSAYDNAVNDGVVRLEDAYLGLEWLLSRRPDVGTPQLINDERWWLYVQDSDYVAETPEIWVLYQVTDDEVIVHDTNIIPFVRNE